MSNNINEQLLIRAADLIDEITGHPSRLDIALEQAVEKSDLDEIYRIVTLVEGELAQESFHNDGILSREDIY